MDNDLSKDEEIQDVINLPSFINNVTDNEKTRFAEGYYKNKDKIQKEMFTKMDDELKQLCDEIEKELKQISEIVSSEIKDFTQSVKDRTNNIEANSSVKYEQLLQLATKLEEDYNLTLKSFSSDLSELEKRRADKVKQILATYRKQADKVLFMKPEELDLIFEKKVLEINVITLSNFQTYTDLQLHLKLLGQKTIEDYKHHISEKYRRSVKKRSLKTQKSEQKADDLEKEKLEFILSFPGGYEAKENCIQAVHSFSAAVHSFSAAVSEFKSKNEGGKEIFFEISEMWNEQMSFLSEKVQTSVQEIDEAVKYILSLYKEEKVITKPPEQQDVKLEINQTDPTEENIGSDLQSSNSECNEMEQISIDGNDIEVFWDMLLSYLTHQIQHNQEYLMSIINVRDGHLKRNQDCKETIKTSVARIMNCNKEKNQEQFIKINILLDSLRQESTQENLQKTYNDVIALLDIVKENSGAAFNNEEDIIEEIYSLVNLEVSIVKAELNQIQKHYCTGSTFSTIDFNQLNVPIPNEHRRILQSEVTLQMVMCSSYVEGINNWNRGLYEELQSFLLKVGPKLKNDAEKWAASEIQEIVKLYDLDLMKHQLQYVRIEKEIKNVRQKELETHTERLKSHSAGVHKSLKDLLGAVKLTQSGIQQINEDHEKKYEELNSDTLIYDKSYYVERKIMEIESDYNKHAEIIQTLAKVQKEECEKVLSWLTRTSTDYLSSVKLFSEGGNYSPDEVLALTAELNKLNKEIDKQGSVVRKQCQLLIETSNQMPNNNSLMMRLQELLKELTLKESITDLVIELQDSLKNEVYKMKCGGKKLENFEDLVKVKTEDKVKVWSELVTALNSRHDYLVIPKASSNIEWVILEKEVMDKTVDRSNITIPITKQKGKETNMIESLNTTPENWRKKLFKFTDLNKLFSGNNFLADTKMLILKSLSKISDTIQKTNVEKEIKSKPKKSEKTQQKSPIHYSAYMDELLAKCILYNEQCEKAWLLQVEEFIHQVISIKKYCNDSIKLEFENVHSKCLVEKTDQLHKKYMFDVQCHGESTRLGRLIMNRSLLPLHGHPNNKNKLEKLIEEAKSLVVYQLKDHKEYFTRYTIELQEIYNEYISNLKYIEDKMTCIKKQVFNSDLASILIAQVSALIKENTSRLTLTSLTMGSPRVPPNSPSSSMEGEVIPRRTLELIEIEDSLKKWSYLINSLKSYLMTFGEEDKFEDNLLFTSSELVTPVNINHTIAVNILELINKQTKLYKEAQNELQHYEKLLDIWLNTWSFNVKQVQKLYIVCD